MRKKKMILKYIPYSTPPHRHIDAVSRIEKYLFPKRYSSNIGNQDSRDGAKNAGFARAGRAEKHRNPIPGLYVNINDGRVAVSAELFANTRVKHG